MSENQFNDRLPEEQMSGEPVIGDAPPKAHTIFSNAAYDKAKFVAQILLPALATFYAAFGGIWGFPKTEEVVGTIVAFDLFLGVLLGISNAQFQNAPKQFDGTMYIKKDVNVLDEPVLKSGFVVDVPAEDMENKSEVTFKVEKAPDDLLR